MKGTGKIWLFFDAVTKRQTRPLSTLQAQVALLTLKLKDPRRFYVWTPGWTEWLPLHKFLSSGQTYFVLPPTVGAPAPAAPSQPPPRENAEENEKTITKIFDLEEGDTAYTTILDGEKPSPKTDYGYFHDDFHGDQLDPDLKHSVKFNLPKKDSADPRDRRTSERHNLKIEVILVNKSGRSFRTFSENISLGGTLLEDELPKGFVNTQFDLIIVNKFESDPHKGRLHFRGKVVGDYMNPRRLMFLDSDEHTMKRLENLLRSYQEHQSARRKKKSG